MLINLLINGNIKNNDSERSEKKIKEVDKVVGKEWNAIYLSEIFMIHVHK